MELTRQLIHAELAFFSEYFADTFTSRIPLLNRVYHYISQQKGKQMRPMFVLLSARLGGTINEKAYRAALFVEMLHTSSLVHDDLVDESMERRGAFSVNALWNNKIAVLTGDHIFTNSILLLLSNGDHQILKIYSDALGKVVEGELLQLDKSRKLNLDEAVYHDIIRSKTATLLAAACAAGAASTFEDATQVEKMYAFGEKAGIAFQIKDDLLDFGTADIGKPTGNDIKEKKVTLPLIYTLNNCAAALRKKLIYIIKHKTADPDMVAYVVQEVVKAGGIAYAEQKMMAYRQQALDLLYAFPASETRTAMEELVRYVTDRDH